MRRPRLARQSGIQGIFILITKNEKEIEILVSHQYLGELTSRARRRSARASSRVSSSGDFNDGLKHGVAAIAERSPSSSAPASFPRQTRPPQCSVSRAGARRRRDGSPLVLRNQVRLDAGRRGCMIAAAQAKAQALKLKVNIAVVDDGGHLIAFERMDGARPASGYTAITKATSAATFRQPSGPLPAGAAPARSALEPEPAKGRPGQRRQDHGLLRRRAGRGRRAGHRRRRRRRRNRRARRPDRPRRRPGAPRSARQARKTLPKTPKTAEKPE